MDTKPAAVTVFPDRARVTRRGHLSLVKGIQTVEIGNLPLTLMPDSVRAAGQGVAQVKLLGVSTRLENFLETPADAARQLEQKIQEVADASTALAARATVAEAQRTFLEGLASQSEMFARGLALRYQTVEGQGAIFDFVRQRLDALHLETLQIAREQRELAKELDRLRRELQSVQSERPRQRYVATIELEASTAGEFDLDLTYVVNGARWQPLYDLRLTDAGLEVTYLAQVAQRTGEDWAEVALTLSTAQPALSLIVPELDPWYVSPHVALMAAARKSMAPRPMPASVPSAGVVAASAPTLDEFPEPQALAFDSAAVSESGVALTYRLAARADVPSTDEPRKVTVAVFSLKPIFDYVTAPKREQVCYRRAKVKNDSPYSLLPGSAQLFEGDEYLGATKLEFAAPGQEFELALGADERLRVERKLTRREMDKTFMGDRRRIRYGYLIEVENLRDAAQTVIVRDQLPVPRDEQIKIRLEAADPKPAEETDLNQLEWKLSVDKGAKQKVSFDFSVEYPRTMDVAGLP
jgi:uncharacterized protein (TIGR02231 family)